jgi:hypothetical protein
LFNMLIFVSELKRRLECGRSERRCSSQARH